MRRLSTPAVRQPAPCPPRRRAPGLTATLALAMAPLFSIGPALATPAQGAPANLLSGLPSLSLTDKPADAANAANATKRAKPAAAPAAPATTTAPAAATAPLQRRDALTLSDDLSSLPPPAAGRAGPTPPDTDDAAKKKKRQANADEASPGGRIAPRVLVITMFEPETQIWLDRMGPWRHTRIAGLSAEFPLIHCNRAQVCVVTTGMGHSNSATSAMALALSPQLDLRLSYILVTGIAAINPEIGTLGSPAWARYLVDFGLQWQLDSREAPAGWPTGYLGINTRHPSEKPPLDYHTEVYQLNENLLQKALGLSRGITLVDEPRARAARAIYPNAPANQPPQVLQCDTVSSDTWFAGAHLGERATAWASLLTDGKASYCTNQQEDNATFEALQRGAQLKRLRLTRVMVLRAGSDFDRPPPGGDAARNLLDYTGQGGFDLALENMYRAARPVVLDITRRWPKWRDNGPPKD